MPEGSIVPVSDTVLGVLAANRYYREPMAAYSVPAAEHSTITSWGRDGEADAYRNMLRRFGMPGAIVSVVSDSYDLFAALDLWGGELKQAVIDSGATLVVQPDSGDPVAIVLQTVRALDASCGSTLNGKGRRVLDHVRVIQGDGVDATSIDAILAALDDAGKRSKKGRLTLLRNRRSGEYRIATLPLAWDDRAIEGEWDDALATVFDTGRLLVDVPLADVRARAHAHEA